MTNSSTYSVKQLSELASVSVKTLHLYDKIGLLKPAERTAAKYRLYCVPELLRLQQILFYRELDFPLKEIKAILDHPDFQLITALESHKSMLKSKKTRINLLIKTLDVTLHSLKHKTMLNLDELYDGLSPQEAREYRNQAVSSYGEEVVIHAENHLKNLSKRELKVLVARQTELGKSLYEMKHLDPSGEKVQELIHQHYLNTRQLWGTHNASDKQAEAYTGLGQLYLSDERFTSQSGAVDPAFREFISAAMSRYAITKLS